MKYIISKIPVIFLIVIFSTSNSFSCTTFCIKKENNMVFGRNFDFSTGYGHVIINKRNVLKKAMVRQDEKQMQWISKFGNITFNQAGRELPYGGINEAGLVIEQMWLDGTQYPEIDDRFGLTELQWIQYQLDNSESVDDVIASDSIVRVSVNSIAPLHFLVCDKNGSIATIEYIGGKMKCHKDDSLPYSVLANHSYRESIDYTRRFHDFGGKDTLANTTGSLDRFAIAASMINKIDNQENLIDYSFDILKAVNQKGATHWSIVYDVTNMKVYYRTLKNQSFRSFDLKDFDFSCKSPDLYLDIEESMNNNKLEFKLYSYESNRKLIEDVCNNVQFLESMPAEARDRMAGYPETTECKEE